MADNERSDDDIQVPRLLAEVAAVPIVQERGATDPPITVVDGLPERPLWERSEDRCLVCDELIGIGPRFLHLRLCDGCRARPAN